MPRFQAFPTLLIKQLGQANDGPIAMAAIREAKMEGRNADAVTASLPMKNNYLRKSLSAILSGGGANSECEPGHVLLVTTDDASEGLYRTR